MMSALCWSGCASMRKMAVKQNTTEMHEMRYFDTDSTVSVTEIRQTPVKVPMSAVSLTLNPDNLKLLPPGAGYTARQGQVSVKITRKPSTEKEPEQLLVEAGCDSLELACVGYMKTISTLKRELEIANSFRDKHKEVAKERSRDGSGVVIIAFITGVATGIVLTLTRKKIWQKVY